MSKQKIADLPQEEQEKLISTMKELGIGGVYATYTVEKALAAIEKKKAEKNPPETPGNDEPVNEPENEGETQDDEQTTEETSDVPENPESSDELPEGLDKDAKDFLNGETDKLPEDAEEISEKEAKKLQKKAEKPAPKSEGICHICRSKVYNGVCSGCGFSLRG